jgi:hypothetical protein
VGDERIARRNDNHADVAMLSEQYLHWVAITASLSHICNVDGRRDRRASSCLLGSSSRSGFGGVGGHVGRASSCSVRERLTRAANRPRSLELCGSTALQVEVGIGGIRSSRVRMRSASLAREIWCLQRNSPTMGQTAYGPRVALGLLFRALRAVREPGGCSFRRFPIPFRNARQAGSDHLRINKVGGD